MKRYLCVVLALCGIVSCSSRPDRVPATLAELERATEAKTAHEVSTYIFENYGCKNCHTVGSGGKFGYTQMGEELKNMSEGCIALLTNISRIATVPEADRTEEHKTKLAHFNDYGCTACHRVSFGTVGLTEVGAKLRTMHQACTDVQNILN